MESQSFLDLKHRIWNNYFNNLIIDKEIEFNWERKLPIGRSKFEHYQKAGTMLLNLVQANVKAPETAVLLIPTNFVFIMIFANANYYERFFNVNPTNIDNICQCGVLNGIAVVADPKIPTDDNKYMLLLDIAENKAIRIIPGKYDYDTDLTEVIEQLKEAKMEADIAYVNKLAKIETEGKK